MRTAVVIQDYEVVYPNAIKVKAGERVRVVRRETNPEWLGWNWCETENGQTGWISDAYLKPDGPNATLIKDYDATELGCTKGQTLQIEREDSGWAWCRSEAGEQGWVPVQNLRYEST